MHAVDAFVTQAMRAEPSVKLEMRALDQQIVVHRAENRAEAIGVVPIPDPAVVFGMKGQAYAWRHKCRMPMNFNCCLRHP